MTDKQKQAIERVSKYIAERARSRGLDQNEIHGFHIGDERETILLVDDLKALLQAASAAPAQEPVAWRMITPVHGNVLFLTDAKEAERFRAMDNREVRPLIFADAAPVATHPTQSTEET